MENICKNISQKNIISIACVNTQKHITISGNKYAITKAIKIFKILGAKIIPLNINIPIHCILMKPIIKQFHNLLNTIKIKKPIIPYVNNVDVKFETHPEKIKNALIRHIYCTVHWYNCMKYIEKKHIFNFIEFNTCNILNKFSQHITKKNNVITLYNQQMLDIALKKYLFKT
ncbi:ACP S-malonyltransferase [Enterobacteriaceae endosymbiont of Neohaemonia nigricornis]|nr:ACP S-malonyltransferase [Enterobacteriaceae endosymbiont of Neohaemonia nigricornis]